MITTQKGPTKCPIVFSPAIINTHPEINKKKTSNIISYAPKWEKLLKDRCILSLVTRSSIFMTFICVLLLDTLLLGRPKPSIDK